MKLLKLTTLAALVLQLMPESVDSMQIFSHKLCQRVGYVAIMKPLHQLGARYCSDIENPQSKYKFEFIEGPAEPMQQEIENNSPWKSCLSHTKIYEDYINRLDQEEIEDVLMPDINEALNTLNRI